MAERDPRKSAAKTRPDGLPIGKPFQPGNSGRPKGSRNKLGEDFLKALQQDFAKHGVSAVEEVRENKPDQYLKVIASLMPKEMNLNINEAEALTDDEIIERLRALNEYVRPFLDTGGARGAHGGTDKARTH